MEKKIITTVINDGFVTDKKGKSASPKTQFKKGNVPWNKLKKGEYSLNFSDPVGRGRRISEGKLKAKKYTPKNNAKTSRML